MSKFANKICPVCRAPFAENADVVVCPVCGTPHHRLCYLSKNRCGVEEYHAQGFVWNGYLPDEEPSAAEPVSEPDSEPAQPDPPAPEPNPDPHHAVYPSGTPNPQPRAEYRGMNEIQDPDEYYERMAALVKDDVRGEDGVSLHELCAFAAKSVFHYGKAFGTFRGDITGRKSSVFLNFCAGLFSPIFQFYRKMDALGIIVALFSLLTMLPQLLAEAGFINVDAMSNAQMGMFTMFYSVCSFVDLLLMVVLVMFSDFFYYKHAVKKIKKIRSRFGENLGDEYYEALVESGRPSWLRAVVGFLAVLLCVVSIRYLPQILTQTVV